MQVVDVEKHDEQIKLLEARVAQLALLLEQTIGLITYMNEALAVCVPGWTDAR